MWLNSDFHCACTSFSSPLLLPFFILLVALHHIRDRVVFCGTHSSHSYYTEIIIIFFFLLPRSFSPTCAGLLVSSVFIVKGKEGQEEDGTLPLTGVWQRELYCCCLNLQATGRHPALPLVADIFVYSLRPSAEYLALHRIQPKRQEVRKAGVLASLTLASCTKTPLVQSPVLVRSANLLRSSLVRRRVCIAVVLLDIASLSVRSSMSVYKCIVRKPKHLREATASPLPIRRDRVISVVSLTLDPMLKDDTPGLDSMPDNSNTNPYHESPLYPAHRPTRESAAPSDSDDKSAAVVRKRRPPVSRPRGLSPLAVTHVPSTESPAETPPIVSPFLTPISGGVHLFPTAPTPDPARTSAGLDATAQEQQEKAVSSQDSSPAMDSTMDLSGMHNSMRWRVEDSLLLTAEAQRRLFKDPEVRSNSGSLVSQPGEKELTQPMLPPLAAAVPPSAPSPPPPASAPTAGRIGIRSEVQGRPSPKPPARLAPLEKPREGAEGSPQPTPPRAPQAAAFARGNIVVAASSPPGQRTPLPEPSPAPTHVEPLPVTAVPVFSPPPEPQATESAVSPYMYSAPLFPGALNDSSMLGVFAGSMSMDMDASCSMTANKAKRRKPGSPRKGGSEAPFVEPIPALSPTHPQDRVSCVCFGSDFPVVHHDAPDACQPLMALEKRGSGGFRSPFPTPRAAFEFINKASSPKPRRKRRPAPPRPEKDKDNLAPFTPLLSITPVGPAEPASLSQASLTEQSGRTVREA
eukprot:gene3645-2580_t